MLPVIGITLGDPSGIGPEIVAKLMAGNTAADCCRPVIIGDSRVLARGMETAGVVFDFMTIEDIVTATWQENRIPLLEIKQKDPDRIIMGQISAEAGKAAGEMMVCAMALCRSGVMDGYAFGPYHKAAMEYGGYHLMEKGRSFFAHHLDWPKPFGELNVVGDLWTARVTSHIPLKDVSQKLSIKRITNAIRMVHDTLQKAGIQQPCIAVCGLNPHCGEDGLCGTEETDVIQPAVAAAADEGIRVTGPFSADTLFVEAVKGKYDGVVTMYHDQGQIALKLLDFNSCVTVLAGLPCAVTTPAHGTAFDIAGKGIAEADAMAQAVRVASRIAGWRRPH